MKKSIICGLVILFPILCNGQHYLYLGFMNSAIKVEKEIAFDCYGGNGGWGYDYLFNRYVGITLQSGIAPLAYKNASINSYKTEINATILLDFSPKIHFELPLSPSGNHRLFSNIGTKFLLDFKTPDESIKGIDVMFTTEVGYSSNYVFVKLGSDNGLLNLYNYQYNNLAVYNIKRNNILLTLGFYLSYRNNQ